MYYAGYQYEWDDKEGLKISVGIPGATKKEVEVEKRGDHYLCKVGGDVYHDHHKNRRLNIDYKQLKAKYDNGLLTLTVPIAKNQHRRIQVE